jgi:hypothetical protein
MRLHRALVTAALAAGASLGGVAAASALSGNGEPLPSVMTERPADLAIRPGSATVAASSVDPRSGLGWALRLSRSEKGEMCEEVGRLQGGQFGLSHGGAFEARPPGQADLCGPELDVSGEYPKLGAKMSPEAG